MPASFPPTTQSKNLTLAVTGASGAIFAGTMLRLLLDEDRVAHVNVIVSDHAQRVMAEELDGKAGRSQLLQQLLTAAASFEESTVVQTFKLKKVALLHSSDVGANVASGSYPSDGMIVLPCSMGTLASIAHGLAEKLVSRAADVCLKERRPLILCVRETPFHLIHLRNMVQVTEAGATIFPVIPTFYNRPDGLDEMALQYCCRVLAHLGLSQNQAYRWKPDE